MNHDEKKRKKFKKMAEMMKNFCPGEGDMADCCSMMKKMMECCEVDEKKKETGGTGEGRSEA